MLGFVSGLALLPVRIGLGPERAAGRAHDRPAPGVRKKLLIKRPTAEVPAAGEDTGVAEGIGTVRLELIRL